MDEFQWRLLPLTQQKRNVIPPLWNSWVLMIYYDTRGRPTTLCTFTTWSL
jgi:hypothetical protein